MNKELLKQVLADNQVEVSRQQVVPRDFPIGEFDHYVLVGIRRAGKSFLLYQKMQQLLREGVGWDSMLYLNFEDERLTGLQTEDLNLLLEVHMEMYGRRPMLFLDEIQNVAGWEKFARRLADAKYKVYITGSNARMLSSDIQTTLGGRYLTVNVYPYDFREYLRAHALPLSPATWLATEQRAQVMRRFDEYFHFGGFPECATLASKRDYLTSVYQKIFLGDIVTRHGIDNAFALRILFKKLAESVKQPTSVTRLANIVASTGVKVGKATLINYMEYAKDAWLIHPVQNIAGKLVDKESNPKYYFTDNGLLQLFLLDAETSLLENLVAMTLLRRYGREDAVFFYHHQIEVDFYVPEAEWAIQVSYSLRDGETLRRETTALQKLSKVMPCRRLTVVTRDEKRTLPSEAGEIEVLPIWEFVLAGEGM
jgi:predicted AAA+ superfamily ATPase